MNTLLLPEQIIDCLNTTYGIAISQLIPLPLGADMNAAVYKAKALDGQSYFVKVKHGHHDDTSVALLAFLQASGTQQIIPPVRTINGELIQYFHGSTIIAYPFIEGQNGFYQKLTDDQWLALGKVLRQMHDISVIPSVKERIRKETYSSKWRETVRTLHVDLDRRLTTDETGLQLQAFMKEHQVLIYRLVDRAEALGKQLQGQSPECVLCHSDIHGGNVLVDRSGSIYIVDWDDPIMAPKECDLMFIGGGVANVWNDPREEAYFYQGYGKTEINWLALTYYRHERIVKDIAEYAQTLLLTTEGGEDRLEMYQHFLDMFDPEGVIDIALKTDKILKAD